MDYSLNVSVLRDIAGDMAGWLDDQLVRGTYAAVSVPTHSERARLRRTGRPFYDPEAGVQPVREDVDRTAELVVRQAVFQAATLGSIAGIGGAASVPPEVVATLVAIVRLAQRLAVVYGFDPEADSGRMAMWQALSAGLQVELPASGPLGMRVRDLPAVLARSAPEQASVALTRAVARQTAWMVVGRIGRLIPIVSAGVGGRQARRRTRDIGDRMAKVYGRLCEQGSVDDDRVVDAVEIRRGR